jgi:hypothetical protein
MYIDAYFRARAQAPLSLISCDMVLALPAGFAGWCFRFARRLEDHQVTSTLFSFLRHISSYWLVLLVLCRVFPRAYMRACALYMVDFATMHPALLKVLRVVLSVYRQQLMVFFSPVACCQPHTSSAPRTFSTTLDVFLFSCFLIHALFKRVLHLQEISDLFSVG